MALLPARTATVNRRDRSSVDSFDWEIIRFLVSWAPYGKPDDEDVLPRFGISYQLLILRFADVVRTLSATAHRLNHQERQLLTRAHELLPQVAAAPPGVHDADPSPRRSTAIDLSEADGQWVMCHGVWHWKTAP